MRITVVNGVLTNGATATGSTAAPVVAVASPPPNTRARSGLYVCAPTANSAPIYVGSSTVTAANGMEIPAGSDWKWIPCDKPSDVYVISAAAQSIRWMYIG